MLAAYMPPLLSCAASGLSSCPDSISARFSSMCSFAARTACVLAANGICAWLYPRLEPTPALSFAVRDLKCGAGICVTASHNPAIYNGIKVFVKGGRDADETVTADLDMIKGEGPKSCELSFTVTVPDTTVLLDGQPVDLSMPVTVTYGTHSLQAAATGYSAWSRQLVVNSETANIIIDLTENAVSSGEESTESMDTVQGTTGDSTQSDSSESTTQSGNSGSTQTNLGNSLITDEAESDSTNTATESYLKTLSGIMDTLTGE